MSLTGNPRCRNCGGSQSAIDHQFYSGFSDVNYYKVDREPYAGVTDISDHWPLTVEYKF